MTFSERVRLWLFYRRWPKFRGPWHPHWRGTDNVELAWRYAEELGFTEGRGRQRQKLDHEQRGWEPR